MHLADRIVEWRAVLGGDAVLTEDDVATRSSGWGRSEGCQASAVVRPRTTEEVSTVLRDCFVDERRVCVQGGLTGLVEGSVATPDEVVLSLERLIAIEEVDPVGRTMTVQAGVPLQRIQDEARTHELMFPLDLGARGSCQIGGNVATNAGGNRVIRYGMTRQSVVGLEAVLMDGSIVGGLHKMIKNNSGYDLKQLFIGSEGTLGVVTRVVLRLERTPRSHNTALLAVENFEYVASLLAFAERELGGQLSAFELMWRNFYEVTTQDVPAPLATGWPYYVLVEALGPRLREDSDRFEEVLAEAAERGMFADCVVGKSRSERDRLWTIRDSVEKVMEIGPYCNFDISLPIVEMEAYVGRVRASLLERWPDCRCIVFGHVGDGNLHLLVFVGDESEEARREVERRVYDPLAPIGGSVSAEHGIGLEKRPYLGRTRSEAEISLMRSLKEALDPKGLLNRDRVFPWAP